MEIKKNLNKETDLIYDINGDEIWEDSPQKTYIDKRLNINKLVWKYIYWSFFIELNKFKILFYDKNSNYFIK